MTLASGAIIGSTADVHVTSVLAHCDPARILVLDSQVLSDASFTLTDEYLLIETSSEQWRVDAFRPIRGWVRRLAPESWQHGIVAGSRSAAEHSAWLSLIGAISRSSLIEWLTTLDHNLIAENKFYQLQAAKAALVTVPRSVVSNRMTDVRREIPTPRIVKTLGTGHYVEDDVARVVFTQEIDDGAIENLEAGIPLIFQERLVALEHLRVVVVANRVWTCSLNADGLPLDWRTEDAAHDSFVAIQTSNQLREGALKVTRALHLGYASQDWIVTAEGPILVDVNPGGQWLFLPEPTASEISREIARWISRDND